MSLIDLIRARKSAPLPIAIYTHTINKEVVVSAVNVDTDTFTSVGHGLANGDRIFAIMNYIVGDISFPADKFAIGATNGYVVNKTDDTFQLSASVGGVARDITTNANLDLTKWHFEKVTGDITISNLPNLSKCRLVITGKTLTQGPSALLVNALTYAQEYAKSGSTTYGYPTIGLWGDIAIFGTILIDYERYLKYAVSTYGISNNTPSAYASNTGNFLFVSPKYYAGLITSLTFNGWFIANGFTVEVYKA